MIKTNLTCNLRKIRLLSLILIFCATNVQAKIYNEISTEIEDKTTVQEWTVTGTVNDATGSPLPGVSIIIESTTIGAETDFDGNFNIEASEGDVLQFYFIGMVTKRVTIVENTPMNVILEESAASLDEVVVVGYGTQRRSQITGAISSVSSKDIQTLPLARADQALQGRAAGVLVLNSTGAPNSDVSIRIRGSNSITGSNDPLVVIDGAQGGSLNSVHPSDIQSFEVLKDASATSIYGSRGANGVILITTKKGKFSKPTLSYNTYLSFNSLRKKRDLINAGQYAQAINDRNIELGASPTFTDSEIAEFVANGGTDWQDEIFRNSFSQNHHLNIAGGGENVQYNISGDYLKNEGIVLNSGFERYSVRPNISVQLKDNLKVTLNTYMQWSKDKPTVINGRDVSPIFSASIWAPTKPVYEADGSYSMPGGGVGPNTDFNPVAVALEPIYNNSFNLLSLNPSVAYEIIDGLVFDGRVSYRTWDTENSFYDNNIPRGGFAANRRANILNSRTSFLQNTAQITYEKRFNDAHDLKITALYETQVEKYNESSIDATGFITDAVTYNNLALAENSNVFSAINRRDLESFLGRINYGYKDKYIVTLTGRRDASSVFGANNKSGFFPSASIAWNVSKENFLKDSNVITNLKLRGSYGQVGSQAVSPYTSLAQLATGNNFSFNGTNTVGVALDTRAPNPDLKWETTIQSDFGIDAEFWNGRLFVTVGYYKKNTEDLLLEIPLAQSAGFATKLVNIGEVENKGIELSIGAAPIQTDNFRWKTNFIFSSNDNKVVSLTNGQTEQLVGNPGLPNFDNTIWLEVGQPLGLFRGLVQDGVWSTSESTEAAAVGAFPGAPKFVDQDESGDIGAGDVVNIGNAQEDYTFGWDNTFSYKNFDLNVFIQGVEGNEIYNLGRIRTDVSSGDSDATSLEILNRWSPTNENTNVPSFAGSDAFPQLNSDRWLEDGSYIRFKNISLGYTFDDSLLEKLKISSLRLYASGTNLITITNYTGYDPEARTDTDSRAGIDLATYPSQKTYTLGLDITF
jgi:TonB-linked SusC/RagA family outer membrane protein